MLLRMVRIQPPIEVTTIVTPGRIACFTTSQVKAHEKVTSVPVV